MSKHFVMPDAGVDLIIGFEGYEDGVYADVRGFSTGGYGHLFHMSAPTPAEHAKYDHRGRPYWRGVLEADIDRVVMAPMREFIHVDLNPHVIAGVGSATFNCGPGLLQGTVGRLLNAGKTHAALDAMVDLWDNPHVLRARRERERQVALAPVAVALPWLLADERRWILEYDRLKAHNQGLDRRRVLRRVLAKRDADIKYAVAHRGGWERAHRRQRHASIVARLG